MTRLPPEDRPSAQELANGRSGSGVCPKCGAVEWRGEINSRVEYTRHPDGSMKTIRRRICQCGQFAFRTEEAVVPSGHKLKIVPINEDAA